MTRIGSVIRLLMAVIPLAGSALGADLPRERLLMDFGWKFHLGDNWGLGESLAKAGQSEGPAAMRFNDSSWRAVDLPHDWAVELPFDATANYDHGYKPLGPGFPTNSVGWYRREFTLPAEDKGKRLWLEFDGIYRDCRVFLNGFQLTHHESGYNSFRCDITDVANCGGENVLAVRVDASEFEGWFYEGAGIYRHVWLVKTAPFAIAPDGIFVYSAFSNNVPKGAATIHLQTQLGNWATDEAFARVEWQIFDPNGRSVASAQASTTLAAGAQNEIEQVTEIPSPELWSPETPRLYKLITTVERSQPGAGTSAPHMVDREETEFGIRTVGFDATKGFLLNGKPYEIKGTCNHQDNAGVGLALSDALQYFRVAKLKEMGCNAIRTSHNEPTAELLEACDRLGLLVMDENRRLGSDPQNLGYLAQQIRRDRNHPSVFLWSLANEEYIQREDKGARILAAMQELAHRLDPTRLCTAAMNGWSSDGKADGFSPVLDVQGFNYLHQGDMDAFHRANPDKPCIGTEEASAFYTRGIYDNTTTYRSAYDDNKPGYGTTAEEWVNFYSARPWASGAFVWTGFDYRGEASPFHWPNINSEFGILDTCGFPKDVFYYYQSCWTDKPVLHLMPHWNWRGKETQDVAVCAFSNCQEVELFLNGRSLGKKAMSRNSHLQWNVKYAPGTLSAKGYNHGQVTAEAKVETTGAPARIQLTPDRTIVHADGEDCSVVTVAVTDAQGCIVPLADNLIHFETSGAGKIIGVGNGDPVCHEPDVYLDERPVRTIALGGWRIGKVQDASKTLPETAADFDDSGWMPADVRAESGPLHEGESAVYRTHVSITSKEVAAQRVSINFGRIDDDGWVYINGRRAGESHDWEQDPAFDIGPLLHAGDNTIVVAVQNGDGDGGLNKGATLEFEEKSSGAHWQRSVFNGLAQVIVKADTNSGEIQLRATGDGLAPAVTIIHAEPRPARPAMP